MSHQPFSPGRGGEGRRSQRSEPRPEDIPDKPVSLRRIWRLFIPYRLRLGTLLALIFLGVGPRRRRRRSCCAKRSTTAILNHNPKLLT